MPISVENLVALYQSRKAAAGPLAQRMREVRDTYQGDVVVPLPEIERVERPAVANLTAMGLDQMGTRVASVMPDVRFPVRETGVKKYEKASRLKRQANLGWWDANRMGLKMYRRGRWLLAYSTAPVMVRPDFKMGIPRWDLRDPLGCFPGPQADQDDPCVPDGIVAVKRSLRWLQANYPAKTQILAKGGDPKPDDLFDVIEYVDAEEMVLAVIGKADEYGFDSATQVPACILERTENLAGRCTLIVPGRINLDRRQGQFDSMIGLHQMQARLMSLEVIAVEKGIFPDEWLVSDSQGSTPEVIKVADGRRGVVGMVKNGTLRQQSTNPGYQTLPTIDRLERSQRINAGIPAEFGGESQTNVRTGRRGENILSATIDFTIQEAQQIFVASLEAENRVAIAIDKAYLNRPKSFYVTWSGAEGQVDYTPKELFDTDQNVVSYAQAGTDVNGLVIAGGQRVGIGTMSKESFMELDPLISNVETEKDRVVAEALEAALLQSVQTQASQGAIPPNDLARVMQLVRTDKADLAEAIMQAQREAQERQAQQVPESAPEAQPGLAAPGAGAEAMAIPEDAGGPSLQNLSSLLTSLRRPQMQIASERPRAEAVV